MVKHGTTGCGVIVLQTSKGTVDNCNSLVTINEYIKKGFGLDYCNVLGYF